MPPYVYDCDGKAIYEGDYVECVVDHYASVRKGERRRVISICDGNIVLRNPMLPQGGASHYRPPKFRLAGRQSPHRDRNNLDQLKKETPKMSLHLALRVDNHSDGDVVALIGDNRISTMANVDLQALKSRVSARIQADPTERWAIMTATTIAETSAPPVRFRNL